MRKSSPERFVRCAVMAFVAGSTLSSPFLHTTRDFQVARTWRTRSKDFGQNRNYLVRIRRDMLPEGRIVDMSTHSRQDSNGGGSRCIELLVGT